MKDDLPGFSPVWSLDWADDSFRRFKPIRPTVINTLNGVTRTRGGWRHCRDSSHPMTTNLHLAVSRKVSWAGSCGLTVTVSGGEIIGSSNLPLCTLISYVILGLLLQVASPQFGWDSSQSVLLTNQINHHSVQRVYRCRWCLLILQIKWMRCLN